MQKITSFFIHQLLPVGILVGSITFLLGFTHSSSHWFWDNVAHWRFFHLIVVLMLSWIYLYLKKEDARVLMFSGVISMLLIFFFLGYYQIVDFSPAAKQSNLKICSINLWKDNQQVKKVKQFIDRENPDVIGVLEYTPFWEDQLSYLRKDYPFVLEEVKTGNFGMALFSKKPFTQQDILYFKGIEEPLLQVEFKTGKQPVNLILTHPFPPLGAEGFERRNNYLDGISYLMEEEKRPTILMGDFNCTPFSESWNHLPLLKNARNGFGFENTWNTNLPLLQIPIDHILVSEDIGVKDFFTAENIGSDHLPVLAKLNIPNQP